MSSGDAVRARWCRGAVSGRIDHQGTADLDNDPPGIGDRGDHAACPCPAGSSRVGWSAAIAAGGVDGVLQGTQHLRHTLAGCAREQEAPAAPEALLQRGAGGPRFRAAVMASDLLRPINLGFFRQAAAIGRTTRPAPSARPGRHRRRRRRPNAAARHSVRHGQGSGRQGRRLHGRPRSGRGCRQGRIPACIRQADDAELGMQGGERVVGDLRAGGGNHRRGRWILPAFGRPTRPASAISFRRSQTQRSSPGQPGVALRGARLVAGLESGRCRSRRRRRAAG